MGLNTVYSESCFTFFMEVYFHFHESTKPFMEVKLYFYYIRFSLKVSLLAWKYHFTPMKVQTNS